MHFDEAVNYLLGLGHETLAIKLGLANIERLLAALGSPERVYPAVQIAGTNGKGSTAAMLDSICRAAGVRAGLYTSPHLVSITERIRLAGRDITREEFARLATRVRTAATKLKSETGALPTFFEQVTAIALLAFREREGDGGVRRLMPAAQRQKDILVNIRLRLERHAQPTRRVRAVNAYVAGREARRDVALAAACEDDRLRRVRLRRDDDRRRARADDGGLLRGYRLKRVA